MSCMTEETEVSAFPNFHKLEQEINFPIFRALLFPRLNCSTRVIGFRHLIGYSFQLNPFQELHSREISSGQWPEREQNSFVKDSEA